METIPHTYQACIEVCRYPSMIPNLMYQQKRASLVLLLYMAVMLGGDEICLAKFILDKFMLVSINHQVVIQLCSCFIICSNIFHSIEVRLMSLPVSLVKIGATLACFQSSSTSLGFHDFSEIIHRGSMEYIARYFSALGSSGVLPELFIRSK